MSIIEPAEGLVSRHARTVPLDDVEWRDSGNGTDFTLEGHAAVFNTRSENLGGFYETIAPNAFRSALATPSLDVRLLYGHNSDSLLPLARTKSGTLELREDSTGLHVWARVAPTTTAKDMRIAMERGDLDQMSFAMSLDEDSYEWDYTERSAPVATIVPDGVKRLYDVSVVAYPAYEDTRVQMRSVFEQAIRNGRIPGWAATENVAPSTVGDSRAVSRLRALKLERERFADANPRK